jgi:surface protein
MSLPSISLVISYFLLPFMRRQSPVFLSTINAVLLLLLTTLTACGGSSDTAVASDTVGPIITLNGDSIFTLSAGLAYAELGATASDAVDGSVTVTTTGTVDSAVINSYTLTYTATDAAGNQSSLTRIVNVVDDVAPVLVIIGVTPFILNIGDTYVESGVTASDNVDEASTITVTTTGEVNSAIIASYIITYTATDTAGNVSTLERTVTVADLVGPVITLNGGNTIVLGQGRDYNELGAKAVDNIDGEMVLPSPTGTVDNTTIGQYILTYTAADTAGNTTTLVRTIEVVEPRPFITTWKTDNVGGSDDNQIIISTNSAHTTYNYTVDWGDGNTTTNAAGDAMHTYDVIGTYTVSIEGDFPQTYFKSPGNDSQKLVTVEQWGDFQWLSMNSAFYNCDNLVINATDTPDLRVVTDMSEMFFGGVSLIKAFNGNMSLWNVSAVTDMSDMFFNANSFNQDISTWNVSAVIDMNNMFNGASSFNQALSAWNVSVVTAMNGMFSGASSFNQTLSAWNVSAVTTMSEMFSGASSFNQDINAWDVSAVTDMSFIFSGASSFNQDLSAWNVSAVTSMWSMFSGASSFNQALGAWNVSAVTTMSNMFSNTPLSTLNFDALLQAWSLQTVQNNVTLGGGDNAYSASSQAARDILTGTYTWTIN